MALVYDNSGIQLHHGDCMDVLWTLGQVDATFVDPPFNWGMWYGDYPDNLTPTAYLRWLSDVFAACAARMGTDASLVWLWEPRWMDNVADVTPRNYATRTTGNWGRTVWAKRGSPTIERDPPVDALSTVTLPDGLHPDVTPLDATSDILSWIADPGDTVLDPMCGTGTTLVAAKLAGMNAIGIELDEGFCDIAIRRLNAT